MNKTGKLIALALVFVILMVGAYVFYNWLGDTVKTDPLSIQGGVENSGTGSTDETNQPLTLAPDFTVYDGQGNAVRLQDYVGKPIVLNFWASWCGPCKEEMPSFQEKYNAIGDEIQFLMVNMTDGRETLESAKNFIADAGYTFPVLFDTAADAAATYGVYYLPTTYFIDAQGYLVAGATGAISAALLQQGIDMIKE